MTIFTVRREVLAALLADPVWKAHLDKARNVAEMQEIVCEFAKAKGLKVVEVGVAA
ncbi:MAG TPA: hypothetical protein VI864_02750 [Candidatus Bathyarchaeia archaeon]|nr:hypothetical protein [Candidatus Bathyarchaeia archaeon]